MDRKFQNERDFSSDRRERGYSERSDRGDRFSRFDRFEGETSRKPRGFSERKGGFSSDRKGFGARKSMFDKKSSKPDFGVRSGPRARALEVRKFSERSEFAKNAVVKLDADLAQYFGSPEAVNKALRLLVEASLIVKKPEVKVEEADKTRIFAQNEEDDDEAASYGEALKAKEDEVCLPPKEENPQ